MQVVNGVSTNGGKDRSCRLGIAVACDTDLQSQAVLLEARDRRAHHAAECSRGATLPVGRHFFCSRIRLRVLRSMQAGTDVVLGTAVAAGWRGSWGCPPGGNQTGAVAMVELGPSGEGF